VLRADRPGTAPLDGGHEPLLGPEMTRPTARALRERYGLLFVATIALLGVQGAVPPGGVQQVLVTALAGATLLLAFRAAAFSHRLVAVAAGVSVVAVVVSALHALGAGVGEGVALTMNAALVAMGPPAVAVGIVRDLRATRRVAVQTVAGVLSFYTLVGMLFAFVYGAIDRFGGDPFFANGDSATLSHCLYFSFTTLMTVGYGDFVARTDAGHTLAIFEALIGQIYLVTVVSLIVGNLGAPPRDRRS
jgi:Ion channel